MVQEHFPVGTPPGGRAYGGPKVTDEPAAKRDGQQQPRFGVRRRTLVWLQRIVLLLLTLVFLLAAGGFTYQWIQTARESRRFPPQGTMVEVGGHRLHLRMIGEGSPTVLLEAPMGGSSLGWALVQQEIAKTTQVASYDRGGYGWSEPGGGERTCERIISELRLMLSRAGCAGPFVLVGSSFGGVIVRALAFQGSVANSCPRTKRVESNEAL